ncbi:MAG: hypothetical protein R6W93_12570 [Candidatus Limnocylindrales bacterium]
MVEDSSTRASERDHRLEVITIERHGCSPETLEIRVGETVSCRHEAKHASSRHSAAIVQDSVQICLFASVQATAVDHRPHLAVGQLRPPLEEAEISIGEALATNGGHHDRAVVVR